jgi:hypothetical protein
MQIFLRDGKKPQNDTTDCARAQNNGTAHKKNWNEPLARFVLPHQVMSFNFHFNSFWSNPKERRNERTNERKIRKTTITI